MRPKKIILVADPDVIELSVLVHTLFVNGYRVLRAGTTEESIEVFRAARPQVDMVIIADRGDQRVFSALQVAEQMKRMRAYTPLLMLSELTAEDLPPVCYGVMISRKNVSTLELLERARVMCARKRGPRKCLLIKDPANALVEFAEAGPVAGVGQ